MSTPIRSKSLRSAGAMIALVGGAALNSACGDDADAATVVSLLEAGEGETITLPVPYAVGQSASTSATFDTSLDLSGAGTDETITFAFRLDLTSTVTEVDEDGGSVVTSTIDGVEWIERAEGVDDSIAEDVAGVTYAESFDVSGVSESRELVDDDELTADQRPAAEEFIGQSSVAFSFPGEPVAAGATWTSDTTVESNGMEFPATYQYELVSLDAESYVIDVTYDSPVDTEVDGTDVSGQISGSGTITGAIDNPLEVDFELEQDASISAADGGESMDMQMTITIDNQVTSSASATAESPEPTSTETSTDTSTGTSTTG